MKLEISRNTLLFFFIETAFLTVTNHWTVMVHWTFLYIVDHFKIKMSSPEGQAHAPC